MHSNIGHEPIRLPETPTSTKWAANHDWCARGSNTKYPDKK